jgi:hypothetical protein
MIFDVYEQGVATCKGTGESVNRGLNTMQDWKFENAKGMRTQIRIYAAWKESGG